MRILLEIADYFAECCRERIGQSIHIEYWYWYNKLSLPPIKNLQLWNTEQGYTSIVAYFGKCATL